MNDPWQDWVALADPALTALFFGWLFLAFSRRKKKVAACVPDGPPDEPYRVFTRDHDLSLSAVEVPKTLYNDTFLRTKGWVLLDESIWHRKIAAARHVAALIPASAGASLNAALAQTTPADWAICFLVDQSGSMRDERIIHTAAAVNWCASELGAHGINLAVLGFSTVGWHGGRAREDWIWRNRPQRPGRLCALLHVTYQRFGTDLRDDDWQVMLHPDLLRENVDGEAIEWARSLLEAQPQQHKLLIVLSDGAPVDDTTLLHNGEAYLWRHIQFVIGEIEASDTIMLAGLGIHYRVDKFYRRSRSTDDLEELPEMLAGLIAETMLEKTQT